MTANFLEAAGTNGFIATPFVYGLFSGGNTTAQVLLSPTGTGNQSFTQTSGTPAQAIWGSVWFTAGGSVTPAAGGYISGWFQRSSDAGTTFEQTGPLNQGMPRAPDFIIPLQAAAYASGSISWCQGGYVKLPWEQYQVFVQVNAGSGVSIPVSSSIKVGPVAIQY